MGYVLGGLWGLVKAIQTTESRLKGEESGLYFPETVFKKIVK